MYNIGQTFYIDPNAISNTKIAYVTSVDLYFSNKPSNVNNISGINNPGVSIALAKTTGGIPDLNNIIQGSIVSKLFNQIYAPADASVSTKFTFNSPVQLTTGQEYAILVDMEDSNYALWYADAGATIVDTNSTFPGTSNFKGNYFDFKTDGTWNPLTTRELKFQVNIAKFANTSQQIQLVNKNYEFFKYQGLTNTSFYTVSNVTISNVTYTSVSTVNTIIWLTDTRASTWTVPDDFNSNNIIDLIGAGAGGAAGHNAWPGPTGGRSGGGGAGFSRYTNVSLTPGSNVDITIGKGGVGAPQGSETTGTDGGQTMFVNSSMTANGGTSSGGGTGNTANGGAPAAGAYNGNGGPGGGAGGPHGDGTQGSGAYNYTYNQPGTAGLGDAGYGPDSYGKGDNLGPGNGGISDGDGNGFGAGGGAGYSSGLGVWAHPGYKGGDGSQGAIRIEYAPITTEIRTTYITTNTTIANTVNLNSNFTPGELIFIDNLNSTNGSVSVSNSTNTVTGTNTSFTDWFALNDYVVINNGNTKFVSQIWDIVSDTKIILTTFGGFTSSNCIIYKTPVGTLNYQNQTGNTIVLVDSNATANNLFEDGNIIKGFVSGAIAKISDVFDLPMHQFYPELLINQTPATLLANLVCNFSNTSYDVDTNNENYFINGQIFNKFNYSAVIASRSNEVANPTNLYSNAKSSYVNINLQVNPTNPNTSVFESPFVYGEKLDLFLGSNQINNDASRENTDNGNATCKHVTTKIVLPVGVYSSSLLININAYKPANTNILVYARIMNSHDSEEFTSKDWTLLSYANNTDKLISSSTDLNDYKTLQFVLPSVPPSLNGLAGSVTISNNSTSLTGQNTFFQTELANGELIQIYSPLNPNNCVFAVVNAITNNTSLTVCAPITNNFVIGSGAQINRVMNKHSAFTPKFNSNVSRYYNSDMMEFDTFDMFALKVVFLSPNQWIFPKINHIQALGLQV